MINSDNQYIDNCQGCKVPEIASRTDPFDYDDYFCCSDCACYKCKYLHHCSGQCARKEAE